MPAISGAEPSKVIKSFYALPFIGSLELEAKMAWQVTESASDGEPACFQIFPVANEAMSQSLRRKKEKSPTTWTRNSTANRNLLGNMNVRGIWKEKEKAKVRRTWRFQ